MIILSGPPGSGKGTQAKLMELKGYTRISVGDILRAYAESNADIASLLAHGDLVPTAQMTPILEGALPDSHDTVILDGAPREPEQSRWLLTWLEKHPGMSFIIELQLEDSVSRERSLHRGRQDDSSGIVRDRLAEYHALTQPAIRMLTPPLERLEIDGSGSVDAVHALIASVITTHLKGQS